MNKELKITSLKQNDVDNFLRSQKSFEIHVIPSGINENVSRSALGVLILIEPNLVKNDLCRNVYIRTIYFHAGARLGAKLSRSWN